MVTAKELGEKYLEVLRSGNVKQGRHQLVDLNKDGERCYCALGVFYLVAKEYFPGCIEINDSSVDIRRPDKKQIIKLTGSLPKCLEQAFTMKHNHPNSFISHIDSATAISALNDTGQSFIQIADAIEKYNMLKLDDTEVTINIDEECFLGKEYP